MSHFQVTVILDNGAVVLFGVAAPDEAGAALAARARLSSFRQKAEQVQFLQLPGSRRP